LISPLLGYETTQHIKHLIIINNIEVYNSMIRHEFKNKVEVYMGIAGV